MPKYFILILHVLSSITTAVLAIIIPLELVLDLQSYYITLSYILISLILFGDFIYNLIEYRKKIDDPSKREILEQKNNIGLLIVDFIGAIPFVLFGASWAIAIIQLIKMVRIAQYQSIWNKLIIRFGDYQKLAFFAFWILIATHWMACLWIAIHKFPGITNEFTLYLKSLYWAIVTLTTVGYGDIIPVTNTETIFSMVVMIFGVGIYGYVIGNVANILSSKDPAKMAFQNNMENLKAFVKYRDLPADLQNRIRDYFAYLWKKRLGYDESKFLTHLPASLKNEVELYLKRKIINSIPLFKNTSEDFLNAIALQLKPAIFLPGDYIITEGDEGKEMYLINKGKVNVFKNNAPDSHFILQEGSFVGEIALIANKPRTANVVAETYVDLYILERNIFEYVLSQHPDISQKIKDTAKERLNKK